MSFSLLCLPYIEEFLNAMLVDVLDNLIDLGLVLSIDLERFHKSFNVHSCFYIKFI